MSEQQQFDLLKRKRKSLRTAVTKAVNDLETELANEQLNSEKLEEFSEILNCKFEQLSIVDQQLEPLFNTDNFEEEFETAQEYRDKVLLCLFRTKKKINQVAKLNLDNSSLVENTASTIPTENFLPQNVESIRIKFPKYHIARFFGDDASKWLTFWNSFETAVHNNESLNKVDKFNYLKAHLGGSALNTVEGFPISAAAYDEAVQLLKERFASTEVLVQAHMNKILSLPPLKDSNDIRSFRQFVDNCNVQLRSLESLGISTSQYGSILCPIIMKLIPADLLLEYNKSEKQNSGSKIEELLSFITHALAAREKTQSINKTNKSCIELRNRRMEFKYQDRENKRINQKGISTATANELLVTPLNENRNKTKNSCVFCESMTHTTNSCGRAMTDLSLQERKNILLRNGCCFNCLKIDRHLSRNCPINKTKCEFCSGLHHKFLCFRQQHIERKNLVQTGSTDLGNQSEGEVFLQTLVVYIKNGNCERLVRAILDTGSQKSYVSQYIAKTLGLKSLGKHKVTHGLFGGQQMTEVHDRYSIKLCSLDRNFDFTLEVNDQKNICLGISRITDHRILKKLEQLDIFISDSTVNNKHCIFDKNVDEIHILLGADIIGKLFTGEIKQVSKGLTAVNTKLGWTVMGKSNSKSTFESKNSLLVHSLLTNQTKISDLWELDSLGIKDPSEKKTKLELQDLTLKHFENTVSQNEDGRYYVYIPWIDGHDKLSDNFQLAERRLKNTVRSLKDSRELLALGNFDLRGWRHSNMHSPILEESIDQHDLYSPEVQVLGLLWNVERDTLSISFKEPVLEEGPVSKRKILSITHRIFDPIGVTCPVTLIPKLILQECWKMEASWDSPLPEDIEKKFEIWQRQLKDLKELEISRRLSHLDLKDASLSLEVFCDASKLAYATCAFLRVEKDGKVTCQLIQARSKVAPLKGKDNRARVALVKTKFGSFLRPVQKLYPLEVSENDKPVEHNTNSPLISGANRRETFPISLDRKTSLIEPPDGLPLPSKESDCGTDMEPTMDSSPLLPNETSHPVLPDGTEKLEPRRSRYGRLLRPVQRL
ncbi:hypothetical protein HNY73_013711 [Argiope bruennichi]|uniref:Peptidase aspartic putative domain-containing protein n=1 Tax=Argiope bruennichi TaxID=94029 RepID=A0A8T0ENA8_ARGBR|nr:hypothetical protein HNY73_013711 [Argiope bruennichi]